MYHLTEGTEKNQHLIRGSSALMRNPNPDDWQTADKAELMESLQSEWCVTYK